ncbi:hypothetical protein [Streptomyces sp. 8L]|uniref:hypothetical protein n=1 Tax=Streptomyces sp. 8L TaxID=2877242 RepID=UPI001CD7614A|nr:hypothetical protein [Streptomyces sp. 8L]MCA1219431.1 hypothetical protein [Streptomyces sp. 8L]
MVTSKEVAPPCGTGFDGDGHTCPTWTYDYDTSTPSAGGTPRAAGTTKATDPEQHATTYKHDADGQVTVSEQALRHRFSW